MQNQEYWRTRFELLEEAQAQNSAKFYKQIERQYKRATRDLEKDLTYWYERFAKNEGVTLADAKKILDKGELAAFKMTVEEYIEKGESLDPKWAAELERASVRMHVSRLEAMKLQMQQHAEELASGMASLFDDYAVSAYKQQYYHVAYEVQKGIGVGWAFNKIDKEQIKRVISKPWAQDGKNFSARIWDNRTKLVNELHTTLTSAIARGENPSKTISALTAKMDTSRFNAGRVVMTESAFINSAATKDALKGLDVEKYEILATLDRRTSQVCRDMDGKVFELKDYEVGSTAPPFHPFCRTTTVPWFEDEAEGFRASRGDDGKYYLVPENMTYHDWEKAFVDGISDYKDELTPATVEALQDAALAIDRNSELFRKYGENHYMAMHDILAKNASEDQKVLWQHFESGLGVTTINDPKDAAFFSSRDKGITINLANDSQGYKSNRTKGEMAKLPYQVSFHEFGHNIDYLASGGKGHYSILYQDNAFGKTIKKEFNDRVNARLRQLKAETAGMSREEIWEYLRDVGTWSITVDKQAAKELVAKELNELQEYRRTALSDLYESVSKIKYPAGWGHGLKYWKNQNYWNGENGGTAIEAFAEFWECIANPDQWETIKEWLPESAALFEQMLKDLRKEVENG